MHLFGKMHSLVGHLENCILNEFTRKAAKLCDEWEGRVAA